ncbi:Hpt domain-containing protein [Kordiimonas sp. SCSIO 12610]|uniref:Hpt domain-containing protein n=1 Tax=Kordiimonas sp. SCSIO 12610 TaxID=2829597 RepID=UPI00210E27DE|nr:Hpt domain-containing protein [Kordiimonas sp. SCSIO 12610]UTW54259.1 Hpt domain-containing protein [Kordiimonas sp. SCSIO 12610]
MLEMDLMEELRNEAIDTVEDRLKNLNETLKAVNEQKVNGSDALAAVRLEAHSLKSVAASFEMKALKVLCHRFEDYIFNLSELELKHIDSCQFFSDRMADCLDAFVQNKDIDISQLMRALPAKGGFEVGDITVSDIEVMLVMEPGTATKIVTRELLECGYRMINVASTLDAIQLIPSMRPDAVICSRVMPELTGIDLACALKAMPTTSDIPVALIASVDPNSDDMKRLPDSVPLLRKGSNFADDVASVFIELGIL